MEKMPKFRVECSNGHEFSLVWVTPVLQIRGPKTLTTPRLFASYLLGDPRLVLKKLNTHNLILDTFGVLYGFTVR